MGTAELYVSNVRNCLTDSRGITARLVRDGLAPKTKRHNLAALRAWAKWTRDADLEALLEDLKLPPPERVTEKEPLTIDEWAALQEAIKEVPMTAAERNAIEMITIRGFRVGDVCRLTKQAVRQGMRTGLLNYKGKSGRQIEWTVNPFESQLRWFSEQRGWLTVGQLIAPRCKDTYKGARNHLYKRFLEIDLQAGIPVDELSPHRLRRTYAVHFLEAVGGDLEKLRQHMGWASIATAAQYVDHSRREELDKIAESLVNFRRKR